MTDFRYASRSLLKNPATTIVVVMTLAIAIATATILASTIDAVWHFIPGARSDRLVFVASTDPRPGQSQAGTSSGTARTGVSIPDLVDWSERTTAFQEFAGFTSRSASLTGLDVPLRVAALRITQNLFEVWGIETLMGRAFRPEETRAGAEHVVVVSHMFWQRQLAGTPNVLGKTLMLDGVACTIVGVLPPEAGTGLLKKTDVFMPIVLDRARAPRDERRLFVTGVLKPGVALQQGAADLDAITRQLQKDYPQTNSKTGVVVRPLIEMIGGNTPVVLFLLGLIAVLVVCIACANVSSIILARSTARHRELAVRSALGASRFDQVRQLMIESFVTSSVAGVAGLALAWWGIVAIRFIGGELDGFNEIALNGRVLGAGVILTLLAPFGFALLPATRMSRPDMEELRQGNRGAESARGRRLRESLVVLQVALALILMTEVGLIGRATWKLHNLEKGFDPAHLLTFRVDLPQAAYPETGAVQAFFGRALDRIQALPGVTAAGVVTLLPIADRELSGHFVIQGSPPLPPESQPVATRSGISADYLKTMRIPVVRGRGLVPRDVEDAMPVALVNQEAARRYWPGQEPIGKRISFEGVDKADWIEVVGIVGNVRNSNAGTAPAPQIYTASSRRPERSMAFVVRGSSDDPTRLVPLVRRELAQLDKNQPMYAVASMERVLIDDLGTTYLLTGILVVIGFVALLLAAAGVYGLVSYSVSQRTREIGLRMALGARPAEILRLVVLRGSLPLAVGLAVGGAGAALVAALTSGALEEVDLRDPIGYLAVAVPLVLVALFATYIPARRATHVDPMLALRAE